MGIELGENIVKQMRWSNPKTFFGGIILRPYKLIYNKMDFDINGLFWVEGKMIANSPQLSRIVVSMREELESNWGYSVCSGEFVKVEGKMRMSKFTLEDSD
jgi:hypothetical protein